MLYFFLRKPIASLKFIILTMKHKNKNTIYFMPKGVFFKSNVKKNKQAKAIYSAYYNVT